MAREIEDDLSFQVTTWENPTKDSVKIRLRRGVGNVKRVNVPPGGTTRLPSEFDQAIRTERKGVVVGGLAPQLIPKGREGVPMHEALAKSAAAGELERRVLRDTGVTPGTHAIDAVVRLEGKMAEMERRFAASAGDAHRALEAQRAELRVAQAAIEAKDAELVKLRAELDAATAPPPKAGKPPTPSKPSLPE